MHAGRVRCPVRPPPALPKVNLESLTLHGRRYLESLGVTPSRANVLKIKKEIPLRHIKLTAAFKSRGGLEDMFYVQNVEVRARTAPSARTQHA